MKKMSFYEPAMCCSTGLCGVSIDPELLRISTVLNALKKHGVDVARYNLTSSPMEFIKNAEINDLIAVKGVETLPATVLDGNVVKLEKYPTNEELCTWLEVPASYLTEETPKEKKGGSCCCGGKC